MKIRPIYSKTAARLCAELSEEDGVEPRFLIAKSAHSKPSRKQQQLCKEAHQTLSLVLAGETGHPVLRELLILSVIPDAHGQQLYVTIGHYANDLSEAQIQDALRQMRGRLRTALAEACHRKHTPSLSFRYAGVLTEGER